MLDTKELIIKAYSKAPKVQKKIKGSYLFPFIVNKEVKSIKMVNLRYEDRTKSKNEKVEITPDL